MLFKYITLMWVAEYYSNIIFYWNMISKNKLVKYITLSFIVNDLFVLKYGKNNILSKNINNISNKIILNIVNNYIKLCNYLQRILDEDNIRSMRNIVINQNNTDENNTDENNTDENNTDENNTDENSDYLFTDINKPIVICYDKKLDKTYVQLRINNQIIASEFWKNGKFIFLENYDLHNDCKLNNEIIDNITCCISHNIMLNPVKLCCNHNADEFSIIQMTNRLCPLCKQEIKNYEQNKELTKIVEENCIFSYDNKQIDIKTLRGYYYLITHSFISLTFSDIMNKMRK
jgi:hypothetical protein